MKTGHSLIFFFLLATLQDANACLGEEGVHEYEGRVGGKITMRCYFDDPGQMKIFCRDGCKAGDVLFQTTEDTAQNGRYSMESRKTEIPISITAVFVTIRDLTKSDSGRYRCMADDISSAYLTQVFELKVEEAPTLQPTKSPRPFFGTTPPATAMETPSAEQDNQV